ncbi:MAG: SDR family oxidoreductase [Xanthomonadales bacterium]|nr:SDR family oxidoreductase [Xanthomonadales bacterium]
MKIAVTGATGQLGRLIIQRLRGKLQDSGIVALARARAKAADLGVEVREADYARPDTLGPALTGIDTLMLVSGNEVGQRAPQHRNLITAAQQAGVRRIVYTSLLRADSSPLSLAPEHAQTEAMLAGSGLDYTVLRNGWYTENYLAAAPAAVANGRLAGSAGEGRISSATRADFADAAVAVLTGEGHHGKTYELAGDSAYTLAELAAEISRQSGKDVPYVNLPPAEYAAALIATGLPAQWAEALAAMDVEASRGALFHEGRELSRLIGRPTTSLEDAVAAALA